jgi:hypothetical protein
MIQRIATYAPFPNWEIEWMRTKRPVAPHGMRLSIGNRKIGNDTLTLNMGASLDCPSETRDLCHVINRYRCESAYACFSQAVELHNSNVLNRRRMQGEYWQHESFSHVMFDLDFIWKNLGNVQLARTRFFRFNESGDFWSPDCVYKADEISRYLKRLNVLTYCNTARSDLNFRNLSYLVRGSGFEGPNGMTIVLDHGEPRPKGFFECVENCRICDLCKRDHSNIVYRKH